jgi:hypothetical protein
VTSLGLLLTKVPVSYSIGTGAVTGAAYSVVADRECGYSPTITIIETESFLTHLAEQNRFSVYSNDPDLTGSFEVKF